MRSARLSALFVALLLVTAACGGDDDSGDTTTTAAPTTTAAGATTAAPTTTTEAPTTTAATTTAAPTTTGDPLAAILPLAQGFAGTYTGSWTNTTFGSTGPIVMDFEIDDDGLVKISVDLGGGVFGEDDPPRETWIVSLSDLVRSGLLQSPLLGSIKVAIAADGFVLTANDVPGDRIATFVATASINFTEVSGTYVIEFEGSGGAEGTFEFTIENP